MERFRTSKQKDTFNLAVESALKDCFYLKMAKDSSECWVKVLIENKLIFIAFKPADHDE